MYGTGIMAGPLDSHNWRSGIEVKITARKDDFAKWSHSQEISSFFRYDVIKKKKSFVALSNFDSVRSASSFLLLFALCLKNSSCQDRYFFDFASHLVI